MNIHWIDITIIVLYLAMVLSIGFVLKKRAAKNLDSYFLGGKSIPWYILGVSNSSGMFDITGTMWLVSLLFIYGLKSVWIPWIWPVFNQIFLMIYLSAWLRRSNVLTGAEWITFRFGKTRGANLSHISVVIFALISVVGMIAYAFKGIGKFSAVFLPWDIDANTYALIFMGITAIYVMGGMFSVVISEILQFTIMVIASITIGVIAINKVSPEMLARVIPDGWTDITFGWMLNLDWSGIMDSVNSRISNDGWELFTILFMMMLFKGFLVSAAGPIPSYDMQRILATRSPKDAAKMSGLVSLVLFVPQYLMIAGLTVLALVYFSPELNSMGENIDFELILPYAISNFIPIGLMGVLLAGLLAAFMSTFAATINAAPAYIVNDIYKKYINPNATDKKYIFLSYVSATAVVIVGVSFGFMTESINTVTQWIVSALWGGYTAANVLKWYWWRFNSYGFFWGMISGIILAMIVPLLFPNVSPLNSFPIILFGSGLASVLGSLWTKPDDMEVLKNFYVKTRPWGFWKPVLKKVLKENPNFNENKNFKRDMVNIVVGIIWQTSLVAIPIYIVIQEQMNIFYASIIMLISSYFLKRNWYDKLKD